MKKKSKFTLHLIKMEKPAEDKKYVFEQSGVSVGPDGAVTVSWNAIHDVGIDYILALLATGITVTVSLSDNEVLSELDVEITYNKERAKYTFKVVLDCKNHDTGELSSVDLNRYLKEKADGATIFLIDESFIKQTLLDWNATFVSFTKK